jgi:hypothetical protein
VTEARVGGQERRSLKKSLTVADGVVQTRHGETIVASYRNRKGKQERGDGEHKAMLTDELEIGNGWVF